MKLIVGLGNPGAEYIRTRHNVGFIAMDMLRERLKISDFRNESKFRCEIARGEFNGGKIVLIKPQTFMNLSGEAVLLVKQFYKVQSNDVWVVFDDVDLPLGKVRIREDGSAGTHNGLKSVLLNLGTEKVKRFRLGVESRGETSPKQQDTSSFVLSPFRSEEMPEVREMVTNFTESVVLALKKGIEEAKNKYSS
ncbi:aminoacyl-tRNA hydrolase [Candidatus Peregrinibacteria bacterium]|jgi:peptidyl-tRNA hydrolase, PTH1 family|nr:aminoacyl-tRNA hydrolase [Candidatus Peregrinibacteria bacterium]MBT7483931.1 aminoacyl-tRNA hydrolase [Candidatus Peregrinibacteria bacterium]